MDPITVEVIVNKNIETVWKHWTTPEDICRWNNASDDWYTPKSVNDLRVGGTFTSTMAARDGSASFDFSGTYSIVVEYEAIDYAMEDGRKVSIKFIADGNSTKVIETFDPETENPADMQREGWQAILNNFKKYCETQAV